MEYMETLHQIKTEFVRKIPKRKFIFSGNGTKQFCIGGNWLEDFTTLPNGNPTGYAVTEVCNGRDDNCDGQIDENILRPLATNQNG